MSKKLYEDNWKHKYEMTDELFTEFIKKYPFMSKFLHKKNGTNVDTIEELENHYKHILKDHDDFDNYMKQSMKRRNYE